MIPGIPAEVLDPKTGRQFPTVKQMADWLWPAMESADYGRLFKYPELREILTMDPQQDRRARGAVLAVQKRLLRERDRLLVNRINVGYQVVRPEEHTHQSKRTRRGAIRRLQKSAMMMTHACLELIENEKDRVEFIHEQVRASLALVLTKRVSRRRVLPPREQLKLPSGRALIAMITRKPDESTKTG